MTPSFDDFMKQISRMRVRFGKNAFDEEFTRLVYALVKEAEIDWLKRTVDVFISERKHTNPPLLVDFREALHKSQKYRFDSGRTYSQIMGKEHGEHYTDGGWSRVKAVLGGVKNGWEAVEVLNMKKRMNLAAGKDEYDGLELFRDARGRA